VESSAQVLANQRLIPALEMEDTSAGSATVNLQTSATALAYSPEEVRMKYIVYKYVTQYYHVYVHRS
jgi:hypothetical protein